MVNTVRYLLEERGLFIESSCIDFFADLPAKRSRLLEMVFPVWRQFFPDNLE
jgi:hypothetical protein